MVYESFFHGLFFPETTEKVISAKELPHEIRFF